MTNTTSAAQFVENTLARLLKAPHITVPAGFGPGPIDLFSTIFENSFSDDATGRVDGDEVDRDGLKQTLLALQTHYNPATVKFCIFNDDDGDRDGFADEEARLSFTWSDKQDPVEQREVLVGAIVATSDSGVQTISFLRLKGKRFLFQDQTVHIE